MIIRAFQANGDDPAGLAAFECSTVLPFEDSVQQWIRRDAIGWVTDVPRATFQRRALAFVDDDGGDVVAVVAWQDITRIDIEGIWLEVLAVGLDHQHRGNGQAVLDATLEHLRTIDRDGDRVAGLVHPDNTRSKRLLTRAGWTDVAVLDGHELWVGAL